jgi:hypothetical protein
MKANASGTPAKFEGQQRRADRPRQPAERDRGRHAEPDQAAEHRRIEADADGQPVGIEDARPVQRQYVVEGEGALGGPECADDDVHRRKDQKQRREQEERQDA